MFTILKIEKDLTLPIMGFTLKKRRKTQNFHVTIFLPRKTEHEKYTVDIY